MVKLPTPFTRRDDVSVKLVSSSESLVGLATLLFALAASSFQFYITPVPMDSPPRVLVGMEA